MAITPNIKSDSLSPIDKAFVDIVNNKITLFGQIPYTIPEKMIIEVIKSSARYFYKYYSNSWRQSYYYIKKSDIIEYIGTDNFATLFLTINPRIRIVKEIYEANITGPTSMSAAMYNTSKIGNQNDMYGSVVNNNLFILETAVKSVESRSFDMIFSGRLPYDFSPATHELILKKAPKGNIVLDVYADNEISCLYNDTFFERHVMANVKRELKRLLAGHVFNLPGDVTMTADEICNNIEDAEKVEDLVKSGSGVGDIIMKRR
jgi:hypothetical protein